MQGRKRYRTRQSAQLDAAQGEVAPGEEPVQVVWAEGVQVQGTLQEYCYWLEEVKQEQETEIADL
jgi:chromosome segregation ATPase